MTYPEINYQAVAQKLASENAQLNYQKIQYEQLAEQLHNTVESLTAQLSALQVQNGSGA